MLEPSSGTLAFLFTDVEGSSRLWENHPDAMPAAVARHDAITRAAITTHGGIVVKMLGDGVHAAFRDPADAVRAAIALQLALSEPVNSEVRLRVRCGIHAGLVETRDNDFFGAAVNRAARIMSAAHGGQVLVSHAVTGLVGDRLPAEVTLLDLGMVHLRDLARAERLFQVTHPLLQAKFPALRSLEVTPNNLPLQLTSFVGRDAAVSDVAAMLARSRLVTLVGAGGLGKTRLSLQVAAQTLDRYPDGAWLVELAAVADPTAVPQLVSAVLGVKESTGSIVASLTEHLRDRQTLLILDNCEHLIDACADLAKSLLQAAPQLTILASSREHLRVAGEAEYHVPALAVPDLLDRPTADAIAQSEAVHLFIDRARALQPDFAVSDRNAGAIAGICRRLDGVPLAIELAAARVATLSVESIAQRLDDRFRLLTSGDRTAQARQQTLRATIDWSHDLLSAQEKIAFRRLAVFSGTFGLESAEQVVNEGDLARDDVLEVLSRLVEKSLVDRIATSERYRMLETMRQYAAECLERAGEGAATRRRHLQYFYKFTQTAAPALVGNEQGKWLRRLDEERDNILAAHAQCGEEADGGELGIRLMNWTKLYWIKRGILGLGLRLTREALDRQGASERTKLRCTALFNAGQLAYFTARYGEAERSLAESVEIARELGWKEKVESALQPLGMVALALGKVDDARRFLGEALVLAQEIGSRHEILAATNSLAQLHRVLGELDAAEPLYGEVVDLARELDDPESTAIGLLNLAMVAIEGARHANASALLIECHVIATRLGSVPVGQSLLDVAAGLAIELGHAEEAGTFYGAAQAHVQASGLARDPADEAFLAPRVARVRDAAPDRFAAAEAIGRGVALDRALHAVHAWLESSPGRAE